MSSAVRAVPTPAAVHCHGIGGDEIETIVAELGQDIGALRAKLSTHLDEPIDFLQLLEANNCLLNKCHEKNI